MINVIILIQTQKKKQLMLCVPADVMGQSIWRELKAQLTRRSESGWKYLCGAEALKIPGGPVISGVCAEQLLRFRAISVSNYSAACACRYRLIEASYFIYVSVLFWFKVQEVSLLWMKMN